MGVRLRKADCQPRQPLRCALWAALAVCLCLAAAPGSVRAQDDDFIIIEDEGAEQDTFNQVLDFLDRYVFASAGGYQGFGGSTDHALWHGVVGFEYARDIAGLGKAGLNISGGYYFRSTELEIEIRDFRHRCSPAEPCDNGDTGGTGPLSETGERTTRETFKADDDGFELRNAYLTYQPVPQLTIAAGRQRPVWGQFRIISPVNLLLPIEFQAKGFSYDNAGFRMPQDMIDVAWFPSERLELRAYYFLSVTTDPLVSKALESETYDIYRGNGDFEEQPRAGKLGGSDFDAFALRGIYYGDGFTLGLTWYNGHDGGFFIADLPTARRGTFTSGLDAGDNFYNFAPRNTLPKSQAFAAELSVPWGRWTWNAELIYADIEQDLPELFTRRSGDERLSALRQIYYDWIVDANGGRGYINVDYIFGGVGFDADYGRLDFGLSAIFFIPTLSGNARQAERLFEAAAPNSDEEIGLNEIFPTAYVTYDLDAAGDHQIGLAAGVLGPVFGVSSFYIGKWRDNLSWLGEIGVRRLVSDQLLVDTEDAGRNQNVDLEDDISFEVRLGLIWDF